MTFKMISLHIKRYVCVHRKVSGSFYPALLAGMSPLWEYICAQAIVRLVCVNPCETPTSGAHYYCRRQFLFEVEGELKVQHVIKLHSSIH